MRVTTLALVAVAAFTTAACDSSTDPGGIRLAELAQQEAKWQGQDIHDYIFDFHYQFGGEIDAARITVESDTVSSAMDLRADTALSLDPNYGWPTVGVLFDHARAALQAEKVDVTVTYDPELGYPTHIDVEPVLPTPAGGSSTDASNLEPILTYELAGSRAAPR